MPSNNKTTTKQNNASHTNKIKESELTTSPPTPTLPLLSSSMASSNIDPSSSPKASLLPPPPLHSPFHPHPRRLLFPCLLITTLISLAISLILGFVLLASLDRGGGSVQEVARELRKLPHPVVILISSDGFRFGYQFKTSTPNIHRLIRNGTEAETGLIPVFPTLTFPNHYSIVTGLYPAYHGIINNKFTDPETGEVFTMQSHESKWWLGEPLWETVVNQGKKAATFFWPGSEVAKGNWDCPDKYCQHYNESVPFEDRVDTVLGYFDLPIDDMPVFITLYFEDPDHQGHQVGPDDPEITSAVAHIDSLIGRLIGGLEERGVFEDVTMILLGDHGMVGTCDKKLIYLEDLSPWVEIRSDWVQSTSPVLAITPPSGVSPAEVVSKMNEGLSSGKIEHGNYLKMFLKEDLPGRLHYGASYRIPPVIGLLQEGYKVELKKSDTWECGGAHGYDNSYFSMRTIFIAHGPQFGKGRKVSSFENVQIYNVIASILKLKGAPNNGSESFADNILLPGA